MAVVMMPKDLLGLHNTLHRHHDNGFDLNHALPRYTEQRGSAKNRCTAMTRAWFCLLLLLRRRHAVCPRDLFLYISLITCWQVILIPIPAGKDAAGKGASNQISSRGSK